MEKEILELTQNLISYKSESENKEELNSIIQFVSDFFSPFDNAYITKHISNQKPSICVSNFCGKNADIILNGHLDVVPASDFNQYESYIDGNRLYGRGAGDMKAGCAIMMLVMKKIFEEKYLNQKVMLMLTTDEEVGGMDGVAYLSGLGYDGDVIVIPDGGGIDKMVVAQKGICMAKILSKGISCHSSAPWRGENALENLVLCVQDIKRKIQDEAVSSLNDYWSTTCNINNISTGSDVYNLIPDLASAKIDIRFTQKLSLDTVKKEIESIVKKYNCEVAFGGYGNVLFVETNTEKFRQYANLIKFYTKKSVDMLYEHGGSDARFFASPQKTILIHRPDCGNIHGEDEWVDISQLGILYNIYIDFILC